jgi:hypothetical protein
VKRVRIAVLAVAAMLVAVAAAAGANAPPELDRARAGPCVQDPKVMRTTHMDLLQHDRDETVHRGIRDRKTSLAGCVDCHASRSDGRVIGSERHFCQGCHSYAAVKLDCFECHASTARGGAARTAAKGTP